MWQMFAMHVQRFTASNSEMNMKKKQTKNKIKKIECAVFLVSFSISIPLYPPILSTPTPLSRTPIPHPLRGAREHAAEKTEPIKTLPESIHSLCLT